MASLRCCTIRNGDDGNYDDGGDDNGDADDHDGANVTDILFVAVKYIVKVIETNDLGQKTEEQ